MIHLLHYHKSKGVDLHVNFPEKVSIRDVTLRDGLQNESVFIEAENKLGGLNEIIDAGFRRIEVTSFVHPKWVPALSDADELAKRLPKIPGIQYDALVPNIKGLERFLKTNIDTAVFFLSASTKHNEANLNRTTNESLVHVSDLISKTRSHNRKTMGAVATAFVCPYAGEVPYQEVERIVTTMVENGVDEVGLGDTIGKATPKMIYEYCSRIKDKYPDLTLSLHLHDTYGYALANIIAGIQSGVYIYDTAQAGLGGCPYAPGAPGNVQASQVVNFLERQGIETGIDIDKLKNTDQMFQDMVKKQTSV
ncbi:hydroxymethylglutaryl-CoA lyase [Oceanobacillus profundus]|uniref:Hydroxymethylglutaryl-CoA lyase n=1 Tax=Oceanobacillus profundus TaxID=372463 RepID=A0A417YPP7_9BACI|nr:hydroxymethylglutaryl-CoA lyase [Oceanobacillus profundus]